MEKRKSYKITFGLIILIVWVLLLTGLLMLPAWAWLILAAATVIFYFSSTQRSQKRSRFLGDVIEDMDEYMERRAEERLGKPDEQENSEEEKDEYDFDDDIKIIKK